jgi:hypothetical protein
MAGAMIAALYVEPNGAYFGLPGVDPWDQARDARKYAGPWPVVAHPPCERWGRFWHGSPRNLQTRAPDPVEDAEREAHFETWKRKVAKK